MLNTARLNNHTTFEYLKCSHSPELDQPEEEQVMQISLPSSARLNNHWNFYTAHVY
jgi:hypothetical protein